MSSRDDSTYGETILDPASVTDRELHRMPLKELSRTLSLTTPDNQTMAIYLRWLEVHRDRPSKLSDHWSNTLLHWSQSLRARGFREKELVRRVSDWKDEHGPFRSFEKRFPPMPHDIKKAFNEKGLSPSGRDRFELYREREQRDSDWDLDHARKENRPYRESNYGRDDDWSRALTTKTNNSNRNHEPREFQQPPPKDYLCYRCEKPGHHLQVCPTNLDPSFDGPPDYNYICNCCNRRGTHYRSLCPENKDPGSIFQRRKHLGIYDSQSYADYLRTTSRLRKRTSLDWSSEDDKPLPKMQKLSGEDQDFNSAEIMDTSFVEDASGNPDEIPLDSPAASEHTSTSPSRENPGPSEHDSDLESYEDSASDDDMQGQVTAKPAKQYSDWVLQLSKRHPEMSEIVNVQKKRPSAIDMAEQDARRQREERRAQRYHSPPPMRYEQLSKESPGPANSQEQASSRSDDFISLSPSEGSTYADARQFPQMDGAFDEESEHEKASPRRNYGMGSFGKITFGKVKATFKSKGSSRSPGAINGNGVQMKSPSKLSTFSVSRRATPALSEKSANHRLVPAFTSALKLTPTHLERLHEDRQKLLKSETSRGSYSPGPITATPTPQKTRNVPYLSPSKSTSSISTDTLKSIEDNFGGVPGIDGQVFDHHRYQSLQKRRGVSLTPTRSTEVFQHTVRKIIAEGKEAEELKKFSSTFKLVTPIPKDIIRLTTKKRTKSTGSMDSGDRVVGYNYKKVVDENVDEARESTNPQTPIQKEVKVHVSIAQDHYPDSSEKASEKRMAFTFKCLRDWRRNFSYTTPVPEDLAAMLNVEGRRKAALEKAEREEEQKGFKEFSQNFQMPGTKDTREDKKDQDGTN